MILYDQDFKFMGMSAETLTFLGYENIDEFTSMHTDFADLFIKKEGFIHKFENFSWIHYVLYSGAANKKAYLSKKNGSEICVDISIKEIFLNPVYDGLRMIYGVKLIDESFTQISQSDIHDKRSAKTTKSGEFSLKSLTQDLDMPSIPQEEQTESEPTPAPVPEPVDFKLDIPQESLLAVSEEEPALAKPDFSALTTESETENSEELFKLNFPTSGTVEEQSEPENVVESEETPFKLNFPAPDEEKKSEAPLLEEEASAFKLDFLKQETHEAKEENPVTFKIDTPEEHATASQSHTETETSEPEVQNDLFSFKLLKEDEEESTANLQEQPKTLPQHEPAPTHTEEQAPQQQEPGFSFNFLKEEPVHESEREVQANDNNQPFSFNLFKEENESTATEAEQPSLPDETKSTLIDQIKSDIEEIDKEIPVDAEEKEDASLKLQALLQESMKDTPETEPENKMQQALFIDNSHIETFSVRQEQEEEIAPQTVKDVPKEVSIQPENMESLHLHEKNSFEETLKNIFSIEPEKSAPEEKSLNISDAKNTIEKNKQPVTKEDIESPNQNHTVAAERLEIPQLGNLGLSKEEELDFIEEFLDDTLATVKLMREYLTLEDFNNIKYNLIKISSSAEILQFNQMLTCTRELAKLSDMKEREATDKKLEELLNLTQRYKEHFSTTTV